MDSCVEDVSEGTVEVFVDIEGGVESGIFVEIVKVCIGFFVDIEGGGEVCAGAEGVEFVEIEDGGEVCIGAEGERVCIGIIVGKYFLY